MGKNQYCSNLPTMNQPINQQACMANHNSLVMVTLVASVATEYVEGGHVEVCGVHVLTRREGGVGVVVGDVEVHRQHVSRLRL